MSVFVWKYPECWINNSTDLFSAGVVKSITVNYESDTVETTAFTTTTGPKPKTYKSSLVGWTATVEGLSDYASGKVDATMFDLVGSSSFVFRMAISATGVSEDFPQFTGGCFLSKYNPVTASVGEAATFSFDLQGSGSLVRNTVSCSGY